MVVSNEEARAHAAPSHAIVGTLHEGIPVRDLEASTRFYTEIVGLQLMPRPSFPNPGVWLRDESGRVEIHLTAIPNAPELTTPSGPGNRHTAFAVSDLEAFREHLRQRGVPWLNQAGFIQSAQVFINDPDGNTLEFQQAF